MVVVGGSVVVVVVGATVVVVELVVVDGIASVVDVGSAVLPPQDVVARAKPRTINAPLRFLI